MTDANGVESIIDRFAALSPANKEKYVQLCWNQAKYDEFKAYPFGEFNSMNLSRRGNQIKRNSFAHNFFPLSSSIHAKNINNYFMELESIKGTI